MKSINRKKLISLIPLMASIPSVAADLKSGPEAYVLPIGALAIVIGFIIGAIILIRKIIKKTRKKK